MRILKDFDHISGVRHTCMISHGQITGSTFPALMADSLLGAARIMHQMLAGIQSIGEAHNELHLSMDEGQLIGFRFSENDLFLLMTDREVNQALINTSVRSSKAALLALAGEGLAGPEPATLPQPADTAQPARADHATSPLSSFQKKQLKRIAMLLAEQVGPAATVLFKRVYTGWLKGAPPSPARMSALAQQLGAFIDDEHKRQLFLTHTQQLLEQETLS